jgi:hypothetical protein
MRRLTKEELKKFDGAPLFPERKASALAGERTRGLTHIRAD